MNRQHFYRVLEFVVVCTLLIGAGATSADIITMQTLPVGNPGNAADTTVMFADGTTGYGQVNYTYNIGKYEVTAGQYTTFLNAVAQADPYGLYSPGMVSTNTGGPGITQSVSAGYYTYSVALSRANRPVTYVTFWDACRFANWLNNGQPTGDEGPGTTETGAYTLTSDGITNDTITRNPGTAWAVTSEDEWYKAAYYDPTLNGGAGGYWSYAMQCNSVSTPEANWGQFDTTDVGSYPFPSWYGTFDQGGNVYEWNEAVIYDWYRGKRGATFMAYTSLQSDDRYNDYPPGSGADTGFRVVEVPEPASIVLLGLGVVGMLARRRTPCQRAGPR